MSNDQEQALDKFFEVENELGLHYDEKSEQEPVAWMNKYGACISAVFKKVEETAGEYTIPLYTIPPKREWVGLTDEQIQFYADQEMDVYSFARAIEAAHGIKE